eukprot:g33679.t1
MWEVRITTSDPADFTCEKCTQLQQLTDRIRELELEPDELRIIREEEGIKVDLDRVYKILKGEGEQPEVMVRIGTNVITRKRDENPKSEYREL